MSDQDKQEVNIDSTAGKKTRQGNQDIFEKNGEDADKDDQYSYGKDKVQPLDEEAMPINDDTKPGKRQKKKTETATANKSQASSFMDDHDALMNRNDEDTGPKDESRKVGSCMDLDLFSYNSASLAQYDSKNPNSKSWKTQKMLICGCFVLLVLVLIVLLIVAGPVSKIGDVKSVKFFEEVQPLQEMDFSKDALPIHHVVSLGEKKQGLIHKFCGNGEPRFCQPKNTRGFRRMLVETEEQTQQLKNLFASADADNNGKLNLEEWKFNYKQSDNTVSDEDVQQMYDQYKASEEGIEEAGFVQAMYQILKEIKEKDQAFALFGSLYTNPKDNALNLDEYKAYRQTLEPDVTDETLTSEMQNVDSDGNPLTLVENEFNNVFNDVLVPKKSSNLPDQQNYEES